MSTKHIQDLWHFTNMATLLLPTEQYPWRVLIAVSVLLVGWYMISSIFAWRRLHHIPGPLLASFSYVWVGRIASRGAFNKTYKDFEEKYGQLVRVGPNELLTSDPELIRKMGSTKSTYSRGAWYEGNRLNPYHPTMFTILDTGKHDELKAHLTPGYSGRDVPDYELAVDEQVSNMISLIRRKYISVPETGTFRHFTLIKPLMYFTLDVIFNLSVGKHTGGEPGCSELDDDPYGFYSTLEAYMPWMSMTSEVHWIRDIIYSSTFLRWFGPKETDAKGMGAFTNPIIRQRFAERESGIEKKQQDMVASFMAHGLTQAQCEVETLFMFVAGSDTTAAAMKITMLYILSTPRVYQRLKAEIATALREGKASSPIAQSEARALPYLQAVIYEGLRIRPVTASSLSKKVPPEGDTVHGKFIPGGTVIGANLSALLRSKKMFGDDADTFRPERFLGLEGGRLAEMRRNVELTFGYGRWMCAGKPIAFMELNKVYFELLDPERPIISESYAVFKDVGLRVRATEARNLE
ncbi:hypothetical protein SLS53_007673 [Cytospora paraplurivora]|uniref:Pisatin demethylase n=1 Tax=Cytospora paraplurivora TaxID=2898453 RepID=A0AAN9U362_9PEZI